MGSSITSQKKELGDDQGDTETHICNEKLEETSAFMSLFRRIYKRFFTVPKSKDIALEKQQDNQYAKSRFLPSLFSSVCFGLRGLLKIIFSHPPNEPSLLNPITPVTDLPRHHSTSSNPLIIVIDCILIPLSLTKTIIELVRYGTIPTSPAMLRLFKGVADLVTLGVRIAKFSINNLPLTSPVKFLNSGVNLFVTGVDIVLSLRNYWFGDWSQARRGELKDKKTGELKDKKTHVEVIRNKRLDLAQNFHKVLINSVFLLSVVLSLTPMAPLGIAMGFAMSLYCLLDRLEINPFKKLAKRIFNYLTDHQAKKQSPKAIKNKNEKLIKATLLISLFIMGTILTCIPPLALVGSSIVCITAACAVTAAIRHKWKKWNKLEAEKFKNTSLIKKVGSFIYELVASAFRQNNTNPTQENANPTSAKANQLTANASMHKALQQNEAKSTLATRATEEPRLYKLSTAKKAKMINSLSSPGPMFKINEDGLWSLETIALKAPITRKPACLTSLNATAGDLATAEAAASIRAMTPSASIEEIAGNTTAIDPTAAQVTLTPSVTPLIPMAGLMPMAGDRIEEVETMNTEYNGRLIAAF